MTHPNERQSSFKNRTIIVWSSLAAALLLIVGLACQPSGGNGGDGGGSDGDLTGQVVNLSSNLRLSSGQSLTIIYNASNAATAISAFFIEVDSATPTAEPIGAPVVFASDLPSGTNQTVALPIAEIPEGIYKVGFDLSDGTDTLRIYSTGTLRRTTLPEPVFSQPNQNRSVVPGNLLEIRASLGEPENAVQWRIFYLSETASVAGVQAGELGTQIAAGSANEAIVNWNTAGVAFGTYRIGISVTDSGSSVVQTSAAGNDDRIITVFNDPFVVNIVESEPNANPPQVIIQEPSADVVLFDNDTFLIQFDVEVYEGPPADQSIDVFYDFDGEANSGDEVILSADLPINAESVVFDSDLIERGDSVYIGVTVDDGLNDPVTVYADGQILYGTLDDATLTVTQPSSSLPRTPGETVTVSWQTNIPRSADASVQVYTRRVDEDGDPIDIRKQLLSPALQPLADVGDSITFEVEEEDIGRLQVTVVITLAEAPSNPLMDTAPALVTVSRLPLIVWLGELTRSDSARSVDGAIFGGVQFEDNLGSSFAGGEDFDNDGYDDLLMTARYAKPQFVNPTGVGQGEAYFLRGQGERFVGELNVNATGTDTLPGFVFEGIRPQTTVSGAAPMTDGIAKVLYSGDADGDGISEIVFGMPFAESYRRVSVGQGVLAGQNANSCGINPYRDPTTGNRIPQFYRGGAVAWSSRNVFAFDADRSYNDESILLDNVGQIFNEGGASYTGIIPMIRPEPTAASRNVCSKDNPWIRDRQYLEMECPDGAEGCDDSAPCAFGCAGFPDGEPDTLATPTWGFDGRLADPWSCMYYEDLEAISTCQQNFNVPGSGCRDDPDCQCPLYSAADYDTGTCVPEPVAQDVRTCDSMADIQTTTNCSDDAPQFLATGLRHLGKPALEDRGGSGFYPELLSYSTEGVTYNRANSEKYLGARFIGMEVGDAAGTAIAQSGKDLIVVSPYSTGALTDGGLGYMFPFSQIDQNTPYGEYWQPPRDSGEDLFNLYGARIPPIPHQYLVGGGGTFGWPDETPVAGRRSDINYDPGDLRYIVGDVSELIEDVIGIPDFNGDGRVDIVIGAPRADIDSNGTTDGGVYVLFRRAFSLEGHYILPNLKLPLNDPERLSGLLLRTGYDSGERLGISIAGDLNFDDDDNDQTAEIDDIAIGNPDGAGGRGEVYIVFGSNNLTSEENGIPVDPGAVQTGGVVGSDLLSRRQGARITGTQIGSDFGINIATVGDLDGDGINDLAIAAPNATPYFDSNQDDANESLDPSTNPWAIPGIDLDLDGSADNVSGPTGYADFDANDDPIIDENDELRHAGMVYVILSTSDVFAWADDDDEPMDISVDDLGSGRLRGFILVGRHGDRFDTSSSPATLVHEGDFLGGGEAGSDAGSSTHDQLCGDPGALVTVDYGGNWCKAPAVFTAAISGNTLQRTRDRSLGLSTAGDVDGDGLDDLLIGAQLADPRIDKVTGNGTRNGGEAYLIYGFRP